MIGNTKGWILAALVLVIEVIVVYVALGLDDVSSPTAVSRDAAVMSPIELPVDPRTVVKLNEPGDAGELYRNAANEYLADPAVYAAFVRDRNRQQLTRLFAIEKLVAATHLRDGRIYAASPDQIVVYGESPAVQALAEVGKACYLAGQIVESADPIKARQYYDAAFSLGIRLFEERLSYRQMLAGVTLMSESSARLSQLAAKSKQSEQQATIQHFADSLQSFYSTRLLPPIEAIYTFNEQKIATHAGDVFVFATRSEERVWKIEAILKLGRMKYNAGRPGDQRQAIRLTARLAASESDPAIRHAAELAERLTVESFRQLRP